MSQRPYPKALLMLICIPIAVFACKTKTQEPSTIVPPRSESAALTPPPPPSEPVAVVLQTSLGDIKIELDFEKAPNTSENFLRYVQAGFYDGTIFHRVIGNFMIQGGGFDTSLQQKPTQSPISLETHPEMKNARGTLAMARTAEPNSATAQFFINVTDNPQLNPTGPGNGYAVFGKVVAGMDVVNRIKDVETHCPSWEAKPCDNSQLPPGMRDVPKEAVVIKHAKVAS